MNVKQCWQLNPDLNAFVIPIRIQNLQNGLSIIRNCIFDTGFTGYLGLDLNTIKELKLPSIGKGKAFTITGEIQFENFAGKIEILGENQSILGEIKNIEIDFSGAEIPIQVFKIPLIGIKSIVQFSWLILEEKKWICFITND